MGRADVETALSHVLLLAAAHHVGVLEKMAPNFQTWLCPFSTVVEHSTRNPKIGGSNPGNGTKESESTKSLIV